MLSGQPVVGNALTQSPLRPRPCMHFHSAPPALCWPVAFSASIETAPSFSTKPCVPGGSGVVIGGKAVAADVAVEAGAAALADVAGLPLTSGARNANSLRCLADIMCFHLPPASCSLKYRVSSSILR